MILTEFKEISKNEYLRSRFIFSEHFGSIDIWVGQNAVHIGLSFNDMTLSYYKAEYK
jgi:hypothetical protein